MPQSELAAQDTGLHGLVEAKLIRVFGPDRGAELLRVLLSQLAITRITTTDELARVAQLLQDRPGFEGTTGAMLSVTVAVRRSQGL